MSEGAGTLLNQRYRLEAELGRGGMGVVYRAHDTVLDRDVAVKVLSGLALSGGEGTALSTQGRARLLREAQAAAQLNHPNIVSVHDAGEAEIPSHAGPSPFVVMELVEGQSLHDLVVAGNLRVAGDRRSEALEEIVAIARQVCAALEHAHTHGIIHRDLKPENVLITPDPLGETGGTAKLVDFGLARTVASRLTSEGTIVGTVFYLAPELALGQEYDGRADLYALGVMLYELTTGRLPFMADDPLAVISQHLHAPVVPPQARNEQIPPALDALIIQLLSKSPQDRPASAAEVRQRMEQPGFLDRDAVPFKALSVLERIERGRMVGRERELAEARSLWRQVTAGEGQVLLVSGEPGIGKTRLVRELTTQVQVAGDRVLVGECYAEGGAPYAPFAQILRRAFRNGAGDRLTQTLPDFVLADLLSLAPSLRLRFPDVPPNPPLDAKSEQQRLFENMVAFCQALSSREPLLLVLEDAHWADSGSLALLRHLARRTRRQGVLLVATYREVELDQLRPFQEVLADLSRERLATRLKLSRLDRQGTRDMLAALFAEEITPEFLDGIYTETEGNPFFVEEVCKALVESGQVYFADGYWDRLSMEEIEIPQSVRVAIQSRVGKLPSGCQEVLRMAAILGREFEFATLAKASALDKASDLDEEDLIHALECAGWAQLIEEVSAQREVTFAFTHGLIPATLAEGVSTLRRRRLHRRAAAAIEALRPDDFEALAYHYGEAGDEERALANHTQAGERASAAYANAEAEGHYRTALDLIEAKADRARLLSELGRVLARLSRYEEAIETWQEGVELYRTLDSPDAVAHLYARAARAAWDAGDPPRGLALCREGMGVVAGAPDSPDQADLLHETARACHFGGLPGEAASLGSRALEMAERFGAVRVQAETLSTLGILPGQPIEESVSVLTRAVELAESAGLVSQAARAHNNLGVALEHDPQTARHHFLRATELSRQRGEISSELFYASNAISAALELGNFPLAEEELLSLRQLLDAAHKSGTGAMLFQGTEAKLLRYRGELEEAIERLRSLQMEARATGELQVLSGVDIELADAWMELGEETELEAALQEAIELGERGWWVEVPARCQLSVWRAWQGRAEAARDLLSEARERAVEYGGAAVYEQYLLWAEAHLAQAEGRWAEALGAFESAVDVLTRKGQRWYRARTLQEWAEAHLSRGKPGDRRRARELLREAEAEFEAMGAPIYTSQIRARLHQVDVE
jgi:tetratricopeptide (TPR) repeat protein